MKRIYTLLLALACLYTNTLHAQGCSDGGFCSLNYHNANDKQYNNTVTLGNVSGVTDGSTFVNGTYISYARKLGKAFYWDTKVTVNYASGNLANNFNAGDIFTNITYRVYGNDTTRQYLKLLGGFKAPLTSANDKAGGKPLPMAYQSSTGTWDALLGINYSIKNWEFTNAYQIPVINRNRNSFFDEYSVSDKFPTTNQFRRKSDVLLRAAYNIKTKGMKFSLKPNILAIYHVGEDTYEDIYGKRQNLAGSQGLTLNANVIAGLAINKKNALELSVAAPFVVRDIRPDGLTREFTVGLEYKLSF